MPDKRRSTYLVRSGDPLKKARPQNDGSVEIKGLVAARHLQVRQSLGSLRDAGVINIEFSSNPIQLLNLPFDPPAKSGLHITSDGDASPSKVAEFLSKWNIQPEGEAIETGEWNEWFDSNPKQLDLGFETGNAAAFRIASIPDSDEVSIELWYSEQLWNTVEAAPTELGIFVYKPQTDGILLTGRVRKLGIDEESEQVMFRWYPKHTDANSVADVSIAEPYGLHPELLLKVDGNKPSSKCRLFVQLELPPNLFVDQYQLDDLPRMTPASKLIALWGERDLEKPEWQVNVQSSSLFQLYESVNATYRLPLHTRYVLPNDSMSVDGSIGAPYIFWACQNSNSERLVEHLPPHEFIGIDSVFPLDETSLHVWESNSVSYRIPAISEGAEGFVESCTTFVVLLGAGCIIAAVLFALRKPRKRKAE